MDGLLGILGKIGFDWQVALANLVNFLIIFFVLKRYAFGPIGKLIKERQAKINDGLESAKKNEEVLANTERASEDALSTARAEATKIIVQAKKDAEVSRESLVEQTKKDVDAMLASGKKALEVEKSKMLDDARKEIANLVVQTTEKLIGTQVDSSYNQKVVGELFK